MAAEWRNYALGDLDAEVREPKLISLRLLRILGKILNTLREGQTNI